MEEQLSSFEPEMTSQKEPTFHVEDANQPKLVSQSNLNQEEESKSPREQTENAQEETKFEPVQIVDDSSFSGVNGAPKVEDDETTRPPHTFVREKVDLTKLPRRNIPAAGLQTPTPKPAETQQPSQAKVFPSKTGPKFTFQSKQEAKPFFESQQQRQHQAPPTQETKEDNTSMFECNICLDTAKEPIVTRCGHLYCWPCIFQWLGQPRDTLVCPVCKSGISKDTLIPIYTKENNKDPRKKDEAKDSIPNRPQGSRSEPQPNRGQRGAGIFGGNGSSFTMGFGIFPTLFSLNFNWDDIAGANNLQGGNGGNNEETREQQIQRFLFVFVTFLFFSFFTFGSDVFLTF